jgi:hypothetical protein
MASVTWRTTLTESVVTRCPWITLDRLTGYCRTVPTNEDCRDLWDRLWTARAMSSLRVPVSPAIKAVDSVEETLAMRGRTTLQRLRGADDLLKHRGPVHLPPRR